MDAVTTPETPTRGDAAGHPEVLSDRPTVGRLLRLAWPVVISRSSQVVVGVADAIMVAHLGEASLAATTTGATNTFNLLILPMGIAFIVSSFSAQYTGQGDAAGARRYGWYGLGLALLTQLICLAGIPWIPAGMAAMGHDGEVLRLMNGYMQIRLLTGGAAAGIEALANYYTGLGNTRLPMGVSLAAMTLNVAGNWLLIDGHLGAPALGIRGAALASALSTGLAFLLFLGLFLGRAGTAAAGKRIALAGSEFLRMLRFGLPVGFNWFFEFLAFSLFINVLVAGLGTTILAAFMIVLQINAVSFMPAFGVASAGAVLVGQAIGASRPDDVPRAVRLTLLVVGTWQGSVGLAYLLLPRVLMGPFVHEGTATAELMPIGVMVLMLSASWQLFDATAMTVAEALRAAGDTAFTMWVRVVLAWVIFIPGVFLTIRVFDGGFHAAMLWVVVYLGLLAAVLALRFRAGAWRRIDLTGAHGG